MTLTRDGKIWFQMFPELNIPGLSLEQGVTKIWWPQVLTFNLCCCHEQLALFPMATCRSLKTLAAKCTESQSMILLPLEQGKYPASRAFSLTSLLAYMYKVVRGPSISCSRLVYFPERNLCHKLPTFPVEHVHCMYLQILRGRSRVKQVHLMLIYFLLIRYVKMRLHEVKIWLSKVFLVYVSTKQSQRL